MLGDEVNVDKMLRRYAGLFGLKCVQLQAMTAGPAAKIKEGASRHPRG